MHMGIEALAQEARKRHLHVAIDGPAGAGKSTVGRGIALVLQCPYVDTGLMYRAVTMRALQCGVAMGDAERLLGLAQSVSFEVRGEEDALVIDGGPPSPLLRSVEVDNVVSAVSAHLLVREQLVAQQRAIAENRCVVMVGRDIGTVVLPQAPVKLWVTASPQERGRRRLAEDVSGATGLTPEEMVERIVYRDTLDCERAVSPLRRPPSAISIETDGLDPEAALGRALGAVRAALSQWTEAQA